MIGLLVNRELVDRSAGAKAELVFDQTPFYAEAGGQVGDTGALLDRCRRQGGGCARPPSPACPALTVHRIRCAARFARATCCAPRWRRSRDSTRRNHTATHLLHAALRRCSATHVKQAGSVVDPGRLRFDFTHYAAMDPRRARRESSG